MFSKSLFVLMLCFSLLVGPTGATVVIYKWEPTEILLAADSRSILVPDSHYIGAPLKKSKLGQSSQCKIHQQGDVFFAFVGIPKIDREKVDLYAVAKQAAEAGGGAAGTMIAFDALARSQIERMIRRALPEQLLGQLDLVGKLFSLDVVFVDRRSHTIAMKTYARKEDGSTFSNPMKVYSSPSGQAKIAAMGVYQEGAETARSVGGEGWPSFINRIIEAQIEHEKTQEARPPRVGGPVSILRIVGGKAAWVEGHQGACPAVQP